MACVTPMRAAPPARAPAFRTPWNFPKQPPLDGILGAGGPSWWPRSSWGPDTPDLPVARMWHDRTAQLAVLRPLASHVWSQLSLALGFVPARWAHLRWER